MTPTAATTGTRTRVDPSRAPLERFTIGNVLAAAPARALTDAEAADQAGQADATHPVIAADHELCERWANWSTSRRLYGPPPLAPGVLGKLTSKAVSKRTGPDAICSAQMMALHLAITAQPPEALDRKVFELHYRWRVKHIKLAAEELGITRAHWYRLLAAFRQRVCIGSRQIMADNQRQADALPHRSQVAP